MTENKGTSLFRCPFEIKGEKEGTILEISLNDDINTRFILIRKAFETFHSNLDLIGVKFCLPPSVLAKCSSINELQPLILPYQSEIVAGELDYRLEPLLPYQLNRFNQETFNEFLQVLIKEDSSRLHIGGVMMQVFANIGFKPKAVNDLSDWILKIMQGLFANGAKSPHFDLLANDEHNNSVTIASISPGNATFLTDRGPTVTDKSKNKNCFTVVKTPFYPKDFARYSEQLEIFLTREADFASVPVSTRQRIRLQNNSVLQAHGVDISDLKNDQQQDGL